MEIHIEIQLDGEDTPSPEDLEIRSQLEDWIVANEIGEVTDVGATSGRMDIFLEVDEGARQAVNELREYLEETGLAERVSVREVVANPTYEQ